VTHERAEAEDRFYAALLDDDAEELYEHAPCGYLSCYPDGRIARVNQTFLTWTGYTRDEVLGRSTAEISVWERREDRGDRNGGQKPAHTSPIRTDRRIGGHQSQPWVWSRRRIIADWSS